MQITRRGLLAGAGAVTTVTVTGTAFGGWEPSERYPDPAVELLDPSFGKYRLGLAEVERLATGMRWCEGPVWFGDGRYLLWSDIPNNRIMRWDEETGRGQRVPQAVEQRQRQHARPPGPARHLRARHAPRHAHRVRRHHHRADRQVRRQAAQLAQRHRGEVRRLDLVHRSAVRHPRQLRGPRGHARAADQRLSLRSQDRQSHGRRRRRQPAERARVLARRVEALHRRGRRHAARDPGLTTSPTTAPSSPTAARFITAEPGGTPDGFRVDVDGNLWCGWGMGNEKQDGVTVFNPDGKPIGRIALPERCANVCFGGVKRNRLFMAASHSLYSLYVNTQGAPGG